MGVLRTPLPMPAELRGTLRPMEIGRSVRQSPYLCVLTMVLLPKATDVSGPVREKVERLLGRTGLSAAADADVQAVQHAEPDSGGVVLITQLPAYVSTTSDVWHARIRAERGRTVAGYAPGVGRSGSGQPQRPGASQASLSTRIRLSGKTSENVEPLPSSLTTCNSPPWRCATCLAMASPSPVPPDSRERLRSTR